MREKVLNKINNTLLRMIFIAFILIPGNRLKKSQSEVTEKSQTTITQGEKRLNRY